MRWLESITDSIDRNLSKLWKKVKDREACHAAVHWVTKSHNLTTEQYAEEGSCEDSGRKCHLQAKEKKPSPANILILDL